MGMFDTIHVVCPTCQAPVKWQTKAGECRLANYTIYNAPTGLLEDISGETRQCENGHPFYIRLQIIKHVDVVPGEAP